MGTQSPAGSQGLVRAHCQANELFLASSRLCSGYLVSQTRSPFSSSWVWRELPGQSKRLLIIRHPTAALGAGCVPSTELVCMVEPTGGRAQTSQPPGQFTRASRGTMAVSWPGNVKCGPPHRNHHLSCDLELGLNDTAGPGPHMACSSGSL